MSYVSLSTNQRSRFVRVCSVLLLAVALTALGPTQSKAAEPRQSVAVERTHAGPYKALAQLAYDAFKNGDLPDASIHARLLEIVWDHGEKDFEKKSPDGFQKIDNSMDAFIKPIIGYAQKTPNSGAVNAAYTAYLESLKRLN